LGIKLIKKIRKNRKISLHKVSNETDIIFTVLRDDIKQAIKILSKKNIQIHLSKDDMEMVDIMEKDIEEAENYFKKRLKSIEKKDFK
jgi:hypothetical protein